MSKLRHIYLSTSSITAYKSCPRRFAWERVVGYTASSSSPAADLGKEIHSALDADARQEPLPMLSESASQIVQSYQNAYNDEQLKVVATERELQLPLTSWLTCVGIIDKIVQKPDGTLWVLDHKTSKSPATWIVPVLPVSDQFSCYLALAEANGFRCDGVIVDIISTAKKDIGTSAAFRRIETYRTTSQIEEWKARFIADATRVKEDLEGRGFSSNQPGACNSFGLCPFLDVCASPPEQREQLLTSYEVGVKIWEEDKVIYDK